MPNLAPAAGFAVSIIKTLSEQPYPVGISEISRLTDINKNMVSRILQTLEEEGWVSRDEKAGYSLTLLPFCTTAKVVNQFSLSNVAVPLLQGFWNEYGESTYLGILHNDEVLYLSHFDSTRSVRVAGAVGGSYPLYCTGPGKVLLAYSKDEYIEKYLDGRELTKFTKNTITDKDKLKHELHDIRERGYSLDDEEFGDGIVCMSAPIFNHESKTVGVIGCSLSTVYCTVDGIYDLCGKALLEVAGKISRSLGYIY